MPPGGPDLLTDLTPEQVDAVTHFEGPLLILAGPGSGKTRVITRRVAWLLEQGVHPSNLLAITFTNKAAGEMRQRVEAVVPQSRVLISTFHSLGVRLLRQYAPQLGVERNFTIYDQADRGRVVKSALEATGIDNARFTPERIEGAISRAKNQLLSPEKYAQQATDFFAQVVARVYPVYEKKMRDANAFDFDDLLYWPAMMLQHNEEIRAELDYRFRFVLIDEYQDTNKAQYEIARRLSVDQPNLCVVGDPDQSIYKFRGSDIRNILDFERDFPDARIITLDRNYRSTQAILSAASLLISHNRQRKPKSLHTEKEGGAPVRSLTFETGNDEAEGVARRIREAVEKQGRRFRDFAIFLRMSALSRSLETALVRQRVPFQMVRGLAFFERKENKDVLAYLRLLLNPRDSVSFERAVNEPARGIGKTSLEHLRNYAEPRELSLLEAATHLHQIPAIKGKAVTGLRQFVQLIADLRKLLEQSPDEVIRQVLEQSGYRRMLKESTDPEDQERLANIEELITAARQFAAEDSSRTLADFLESITLASDLDGWDETQDCVSIMTMHAAKGLEFPVVYIIAVEQGILPHERSLSREEEVEEERRLAFVGMTRAKEELHLCHARMREFRGQVQYAVPSMFFGELPQNEIEEIQHTGSFARSASVMDSWRAGADTPAWLDPGVAPTVPLRPAPRKTKLEAATGMATEYKQGSTVKHETYGLGRVVETSGYGPLRKIKIRFASAGERSFLLDKVKLTVVKEG